MSSKIDYQVLITTSKIEIIVEKTIAQNKSEKFLSSNLER